MYRREYLAEVPAVTVARYLSVVGTYLEDTLALSFVEDLPDGSGELPAHGATVEYVVLRDSTRVSYP